MKNSAEFNIMLNGKNKIGMSAFHWVCGNDHTSIIEMMISKAESLKLDLAARNNRRRTGYEVAKYNGESEAVNLIKSKLCSLAKVMLNITYQPKSLHQT